MALSFDWLVARRCRSFEALIGRGARLIVDLEIFFDFLFDVFFVPFDFIPFDLSIVMFDLEKTCMSQ